MSGTLQDLPPAFRPAEPILQELPLEDPEIPVEPPPEPRPVTPPEPYLRR